jgi:hypothetical protein
MHRDGKDLADISSAGWEADRSQQRPVVDSPYS